MEEHARLVNSIQDLTRCTEIHTKQFAHLATWFIVPARILCNVFLGFIEIYISIHNDELGKKILFAAHNAEVKIFYTCCLLCMPKNKMFSILDSSKDSTI